MQPVDNDCFCEEEDVAIQHRALEQVLPPSLLALYPIYRVGEVCMGDHIVFSEPARFRGRAPRNNGGLRWICGRVTKVDFIPGDGRILLDLQVRAAGSPSMNAEVTTRASRTAHGVIPAHIQRSLGNLVINGIRRMPWISEAVRDQRLRAMRESGEQVRRQSGYTGAQLRASYGRRAEATPDMTPRPAQDPENA